MLCPITSAMSSRNIQWRHLEYFSWRMFMSCIHTVYWMHDPNDKVEVMSLQRWTHSAEVLFQRSTKAQSHLPQHNSEVKKNNIYTLKNPTNTIHLWWHHQMQESKFQLKKRAKIQTESTEKWHQSSVYKMAINEDWSRTQTQETSARDKKKAWQSTMVPELKLN